MKLAIICDDAAVYKDGLSFSGLDFSIVPANVHAVQFNDVLNVGWIEFAEDALGNKPTNEKITYLPAWATAVSSKWDELKAALDAEEAAALAAEEAAALAAKEGAT